MNFTTMFFIGRKHKFYKPSNKATKWSWCEIFRMSQSIIRCLYLTFSLSDVFGDCIDVENVSLLYAYNQPFFILIPARLLGKCDPGVHKPVPDLIAIAVEYKPWFKQMWTHKNMINVLPFEIYTYNPLWKCTRISCTQDCIYKLVCIVY